MLLRAIVPAALLLAVAAGLPAQPYPARTAAERLAPERLAAVRAGVVRLAAQRVEVPGPPGLHDFRAIFHAHAGDSAHTGGTLEELLAEAQRAAVSIVFLSDHHRPPRDFMESWRGVREGVLFVPGSEARGLLIHPERSVLGLMDAEPEALRRAVVAGSGLAFLSHVESRADDSLEHLTGMEIYNRHADVDDDQDSMRLLAAWMTDPEGIVTLSGLLERYPAELLASQVHYPWLYLERWDRETRRRRVVGVGANDCHHNQVFVVLRDGDDAVRLGTVVDDFEEMRRVTSAERPGIPELVAGRRDRDEIARFDFDPYALSMHNVSTHVLAPALDEAAVRAAVAAGRVYVAHDWMADATGFRFEAETPSGERLRLGDEAVTDSATLRAEVAVPARLRLLLDGAEVLAVDSRVLEHRADRPGVYRLEAWLELDGELRPWIYSNPIYLRVDRSSGGAVRPQAAR
ncbi:MAG TPA: histidinol phosphatase [Thermoanaerobaculia bacterium]|nr:histidinol phosphatase [Thermoanaerobaculia bacterium]